MKKHHESVLLQEVVSAFEGVDCQDFFEGTVGAGGHAKAILSAHSEIKRYFACDRDSSALEIAKQELLPWEEKISWIHGPFADLESYLKDAKVDGIDGFLIDIGVSSMQIDQGERGFSFAKDAPLDMRMDTTSFLTAEKIINESSQEELARIFYEYGEERRSRKVAEAVVIARRKKRIVTTKQLVDVVMPVATRGKLHPATLVFQALRIAVNDELGQLQKGLKAAISSLRKGGRLAVISFHSLEDRIVKHMLKDSKEVMVLTKKPIIPSLQEQKENRRSRSAKLRIAEKK